MLNEIWSKIILTAVGFIVTGALGYFTATIKNYKKKEDNQQEALKCLLRSQITSKYYVYGEIGEIPRYERENIIYMHTQYKNMNGNSYVDEIYPEILELPIKK